MTSARAASANLFHLEISPRQRWGAAVTFLISLGVSVAVSLGTDKPGLWGLVPVLTYAVLALFGIDMVLATLGAIVSAVILAHTSVADIGDVLQEGLGSFVGFLGVIIMLGGGLGEVIRRAGVADHIVASIVRVIGTHSLARARIAVMIACAVLAFALGTLAGSVAIVAPLVIPLVAAVGYTPPATAAMFFFSGLSGLVMSPFAPATIAIFTSAKVTYADYLLHSGAPCAIVMLVAGFFVVRWNQKRTEGRFAYDPERAAATVENTVTPQVRRATWAFGLTFLVAVLYAAITQAGATFVPIAMVTMATVTGLVARMPVASIVEGVYAGASRLLGLFFLFWLLGVLFAFVDALKPYDDVVQRFGSDLATFSPFLFAIAVALIGWLGVGGAAPAQAVLLAKVFGPLGATVGISPVAWSTILLASAQTDGLGPFPNPDMIGQMGLAESNSLRWQLISCWLVLIPVVALFVVLLGIYT